MSKVLSTIHFMIQEKQEGDRTRTASSHELFSNINHFTHTKTTIDVLSLNILCLNKKLTP